MKLLGPVRMNAMEPAGGAQNDLARHYSSDASGSWTAPEYSPSVYLRVLYRRRWAAILTFLVVFSANALDTLRAIPIFEGRTTLLIEVADPKIVTFSQIIDQDRLSTDFYQTQYALLQSRRIAGQTIESLNLWHHPELGGAVAIESASGPASAPPRQLLGRLWSTVAWLRAHAVSLIRPESPGPPAAPISDDPRDRVIAALQQRLAVEPMKNSRLVEVRFRSTDRLLASQVPNMVARNYIAQTMDFRLQASKDASRWLEQQLAEQRRAIQVSQEALQRYREQNDALTLDDKPNNIVVQKLGDLNAAVTRAKTTRIEKEALYNQVRSVGDDAEVLDTFPAVLTNPFIQRVKSELADLQRQQAQLSERLGDRHPDMVNLKSTIKGAQAKLQKEIGKVVEAVRAEYLSAQEQETRLVAELDAQKNVAMSLERKAIQYGVLERDAASTRELFQSLLQRAKEMEVSSELKTTNIRIVDEAPIPRSPVSPDRPRSLILGFLAAVVLAAGLAFGLEYCDHRIKSPDEVRRLLGVPFLALIPKFPGGRRKSKVQVFGNTSPQGMLEAFGDLRASVLVSAATDGPLILLVTSAGPGEGKSLIAVNLATAIARAERSVLLIDFDLRRPTLHTAFGQPLEPGLVELLADSERAADVSVRPTASVRKTPVPGLFVLPAGRADGDPGALLASPSFAVFLRDAARHFDCVVLDSPPLLAVADAATLVRETNGVVFVASAKKTNRRAAQLALAHLNELGATILGVVLNYADITRHGFYYDPYYRREYVKYYSMPTKS